MNSKADIDCTQTLIPENHPKDTGRQKSLAAVDSVLRLNLKP